MSDTPENPIPDAVRAYVESRTRTYPGGAAYVIDDGGYARFHSSRDGCPNWTPDDLIEYTRRARPELWNDIK